jgi:two-component system response regulator
MDRPTEGSSADILLVEDNACEVELTLHAFGKHHPQWKIDVVRDGEEALEYMFYRGRYQQRSSAQPRLILLDLKLPRVDGLEVLDRVKTDTSTRCVPVVMLTSSKEPRDMQESYHRGVNSYVVKPVDYQAFDEAVRLMGTYWLEHNTLSPS